MEINMPIQLKIPFEGSLDRYVNGHISPGSFLRAVLENDLMNAISRADDTSRELLFDLVKWIFNNLPHNCWGSKEAVEQWLNIK